ncbi:nucleoside phosphorylase domain-containing protein [Spinellus fusiger]|nr:nucleoside phosphorylase domain-containing protein [Spinellus fusiger]
MKETLHNANFPQDTEGHVYHLGVKQGQVANRILTVGDSVRAKAIAQLLDTEEQSGHPTFIRLSQRGFLTITGRYKGVPVTIMAIGMGNCMMDFFVRETRAVTRGPMAILRFGSCGSVAAQAPPGSVIVPKAGYCIRRNLNYFSSMPPPATRAETRAENEKPYTISGLFAADKELTHLLETALQTTVAPLGLGAIVTGGLNADGCSFYSSQGRLDPLFWDDNETVIADALAMYPTTDSLEMETSMLFHLAACARDPKRPIRAAGCMQVFADRVTNQFIEPHVVAVLEPAVGKAVLDVLVQVSLDVTEPLEEAGTVWERRPF